MRVALLSWSMDPTNGWGNITYELCNELSRKKDISFNLHLPRNAWVDSQAPFRAQVYRTLPQWRSTFGRGPHHALPFLFPTSQLIGVDIIHSLIEFPYAIVAWRLARRLGIPFVVSTQGTYGVLPFLRLIDRWWYRPAMEAAAKITAPSQFSADAALWASGLKRPVSVIHNAVNYQRFQQGATPDSTRTRYGVPTDARVILGVGSLKLRKGFDVLLRAFARVLSEDPRAYLLIAGEGSDRKSLQALAVSLGIAPRVQLLGTVEGSLLVDLYHLCEVYAHLPRNVGWNFEGFGIVYLEAGACGKPVVATRSGGVDDAVLADETGLLVDEDDDKAAAEAICRLLRDPSLARSLGESGRKYAAQHSWSWYADQVMGLYRELFSLNEITP